MNGRRSIAAILLFVMLGFTSAWRLQLGIDRQLTSIHQEKNDLLFRSGRLIKLLSLEYGTFLADVYWTRAVQYYGDKRSRHDDNFELLSPLLDLTTTLDPELLVAYRFGGVFLAQASPAGAGRPDLAVALIRRGIAANPDYWRLYEDLGFIYYWDLRDYHKASEAFLEGSKNPHALVWMKVMAAKIAQEGRSRETSLFLWRQIYDSTQDPAMRENALHQMEMLKVEQDLEQLDELLFEFEQRYARLPSGWAELVSMGILAGNPVDPRRVPYVLDSSGKVRLSPASPLARNPLHTPSRQ